MKKENNLEVEDFQERFKVILGNDTYQEYANKINWTYQSVKRYAEGTSKPSYEFLQKLKSIYPEIDLNWLVSGVNSENKKYIETIDELKKEVDRLNKLFNKILTIIKEEF